MADDIHLPEGPLPSDAVREDAIRAAMDRYDQKSSGRVQGSSDRSRLTERNAGRRSGNRERSMGKTRILWGSTAAAALLVLAAAPMLSRHLTLPAGRGMVDALEENGIGPSASSADKPGPFPLVEAEGTKAKPEAVGRTEADAARLANAEPPPVAAPPPAAAPAKPSPPQGKMRAADAAAKMSAPEMSPPSPARQLARSDAAGAQEQEPAGGRFDRREASGFKDVSAEPVSTFSLDVDTTSYSFMRASLARNLLPPPASVRPEEFLNYFPYDYAAPKDRNEPFAVTATVAPSPWNANRQVIHVAVKGYALDAGQRPRAHLTFLIDTSGSMSGPNRLPLAKQALSMLVDTLRPDDTIGIVTYAGSAGVALEPTPASQKGRILDVIASLGSGGSTAGQAGIAAAYDLAERNFEKGALNRVVLATDGDFNVGIANPGELQDFVASKRQTGIFLSVLGFGMGNYNDSTMQALAQHGNGAAAYIDTLAEARKVLVDEATSSMFPIASDVKVQVEFNPARVSEYRLVGYEKRLLAREDFNNDKVDAGEVGSGKAVTVVYEIVPVGAPGTSDPLRYTTAAAQKASPAADELAFVKLRYKLPGSDTSALMSVPVPASGAVKSLEAAPRETRWALAVADFAEILRGGKYASGDFDRVLALAQGARGEDPYGYRAEFVQLVRAAKTALPAQQPDGVPGTPVPLMPKPAPK
jgi:Ca-activated chloride channel family protein